MWIEKNSRWLSLLLREILISSYCPLVSWIVLPYMFFPVRIYGPLVSSIIASFLEGWALLASRITSTNLPWDSWVPCEKFSRATFIPWSMSFSSIYTEEDFGLWYWNMEYPRVHIFLVLLTFKCGTYNSSRQDVSRINWGITTLLLLRWFSSFCLKSISKIIFLS